MRMYEYYGIKDMTLDQEINLPENEKKTENNKIRMIDELAFIERIAKEKIEYARRIPMLNSDKHSKLVNEYASKIHEAYVAMTALI